MWGLGIGIAFAALLLVYPRQTVFACLGVLVLSGIGIGGYLGLEGYRSWQKDRVAFTVLFDYTPCADTAKPILVIVDNPTNQTIEKVFFRVVARVPGRSNDILQTDQISDDKVIPPAGTSRLCVAIPNLTESQFNADLYKRLSKLEWSADRTNARFQ
ncbi:MAG TPA: hypothetical protein DEO85_14935 [Maritimibacter sp.]|nr:hypothetical protein [Maritimibacter sp.]